MAQKNKSNLPNKIGGYVYVLACGKYFKIGKTRRMASRLSDYHIHNPYKVKLVYYINCRNPKLLEGLICKMYLHLLHKGEWFELKPSDVEDIKRIMTLWQNNKN